MTDKILDFIKANPDKSADAVFRQFRGAAIDGQMLKREDVRELFKAAKSKQSKEGDELVRFQLAEAQEKLSKIERLEKGFSIHKIDPATHTGELTEGTAIMVASDWHIEEQVKGEWVNNLNSYDLNESRRRADLFFRNGLKLTQMFSKNLKINNIVLGLLGDFFSNDIHDELAEINLLPPMDACLRAQEYLASGIQFLLDNSKCSLTIVCCSGNHARTTHDTYFSNEAGHSLEFYMYRNLENHFKDNPRVTFIVKSAYHAYLDVLGFKIRFHHGHAIRYGGGIGGLFVPAYKKIDKWNNSIKVDLDIFGHHHQYKDGGSFVSNGSMIGYNAYSLRNGFSFERPQQAYILVDAKRGRTISAPILFQ